MFTSVFPAFQRNSGGSDPVCLMTCLRRARASAAYRRPASFMKSLASRVPRFSANAFRMSMSLRVNVGKSSKWSQSSAAMLRELTLMRISWPGRASSTTRIGRHSSLSWNSGSHSAMA